MEQVFMVQDRRSGVLMLFDVSGVERLLGIELNYINWAIQSDGVFENPYWRVS
ncbi:hypothetical protein ACFFUT_08570 [Pseudohalocynthiibacter aestuariivivens]|uniref:Uncharacterized protein n=1 Tax=Pseudohalocynthiibacter aestuariivivens TaxID=1591409 RepID=A0ABV5JH72_9RHOB|nr:hypothetical protein [Pseudohalocynthiibacter aestuariivivens]MBS9717040.1 hypothetical protein [Pseudohalocynthiibacter aestuariivivens]